MEIIYHFNNKQILVSLNMHYMGSQVSCHDSAYLLACTTTSCPFIVGSNVLYCTGNRYSMPWAKGKQGNLNVLKYIFSAPTTQMSTSIVF